MCVPSSFIIMSCNNNMLVCLFSECGVPARWGGHGQFCAGNWAKEGTLKDAKGIRRSGKSQKIWHHSLFPPPMLTTIISLSLSLPPPSPINYRLITLPALYCPLVTVRLSRVFTFSQRSGTPLLSSSQTESLPSLANIVTYWRACTSQISTLDLFKKREWFPAIRANDYCLTIFLSLVQWWFWCGSRQKATEKVTDNIQRCDPTKKIFLMATLLKSCLFFV